ncbi:formyltransferase family protein [Rhizobium leguminosarum]
MNRLRIAFLASNNGTSFRAVYEAIQSDKLDATAVLLVTNKNHSPAFAFAEEHGVPSFHIPTKCVEADADKRLQETLVGYGADLVVLSGLETSEYKHRNWWSFYIRRKICSRNAADGRFLGSKRTLIGPDLRMDSVCSGR